MKYLKRVELLAIAIAIGTVALGMVSSHAQDSARTTVKVLRLDGPELSGGLVNASQEGIELTVDGEKQLLAGNALSRVVFENRVGSGGVQPLLLGLVDGSRLVGAKISGKEQGWQVADSAGGVLGVGPGSVRYLQVRPLAGELRKSFDAAILEPATSDSLLVVRPGDTLDRVNGLIKEIKESKVLFDLDGDVVEVSFEKLAGMVWFRKASERVKPKVAVNTTDGGTVYPDTFRLVGDRFELQGSAGDLSIPINRIASLAVPICDGFQKSSYWIPKQKSEWIGSLNPRLLGRRSLLISKRRMPIRRLVWGWISSFRCRAVTHSASLKVSRDFKPVWSAVTAVSNALS
jgi:hypothetical protein